MASTKSYSESLSTVKTCISVVLKKIEACMLPEVLQQMGLTFPTYGPAFIELKGYMKEIEKLLFVIQTFITGQQLSNGVTFKAWLNQTTNVVKDVDELLDGFACLIGETKEQTSNDSDDYSVDDLLIYIAEQLKQMSYVLRNLLELNQEISLAEREQSRWLEHGGQKDIYIIPPTVGECSMASTKSHSESLSTVKSCISVVLKKIEACMLPEVLQQMGLTFPTYGPAFIELEGYMKEIEKLLFVIQTFMTGEQLSNGVTFKAWLNQTTNIVKDVEELIDGFACLIGETKEQTSNDSDDCSFHDLLIYIAEQLKQMSYVLLNLLELNQEIPLAGREQSRWLEHGSQKDNYGTLSTMDAARQITSFVNIEAKDEIVGREAGRRMLQEWLTDTYPNRTVVAIYGVGGVGKTSLARKLYMDNTIRSLFDYHAWVSTSRIYEIGDLLRKILSQLLGTEQSCDVDSTDDTIVVQEIRSYLQDRRYMVVLDNIWDRDLWLSIKHAFPAMNTASRVIITTRSKDVASLADKNRVIYLQNLTDKGAQDLLFEETSSVLKMAQYCPEGLMPLGDSSSHLKRSEALRLEALRLHVFWNFGRPLSNLKYISLVKPIIDRLPNLLNFSISGIDKSFQKIPELRFPVYSWNKSANSDLYEERDNEKFAYSKGLVKEKECEEAKKEWEEKNKGFSFLPSLCNEKNKWEEAKMELKEKNKGFSFLPSLCNEENKWEESKMELKEKNKGFSIIPSINTGARMKMRNHKIVVKVSVFRDSCKNLIFKTVAKLEGIQSLSLDIGKGTLTVIGSVDPVCVISALRKKKIPAQIESVGPPEDKKEDDKKNECEEAYKNFNECSHSYKGPPYDPLLISNKEPDHGCTIM